MFKTWIPASAGMTMLLLSSLGCVTRQDIRGLQTDLYNIQQGLETRLGSVKDQTDTVQTTQADLGLEMKNLSSNLSALQAELQDNREQMKALSLRLDDLETALTARMDAQIELLSGSKFVEKPLPSTVYNLANNDFTRGKDEEALRGFQNYIKQFPKAEQVPNAWVKIGDIYTRQKKEVDALEAYDRVIKDFPKTSVSAPAQLKKGRIYETLGKPQVALKVYETLIRTHPYTAEAKSAQERLSEIQNTTNR